MAFISKCFIEITLQNLDYVETLDGTGTYDDIIDKQPYYRDHLVSCPVLCILWISELQNSSLDGLPLNTILYLNCISCSFRNFPPELKCYLRGCDPPTLPNRRFRCSMCCGHFSTGFKVSPKNKFLHLVSL